MPPPDSPAPPRLDRFDRYELIEQVGQGGMGIVYKAFDPKIQRTVALKVLFQHGGDDLERFQREVRSAAQLRHPNIVEVLDVGVSNGRYFYTMPFVDGVSLAELIDRRGALEPTFALLVARSVARALTAAHERGIIHRDIKPGNVMLARIDADTDLAHNASVLAGGNVLLTDFGLAKELSSTRRLTLSGAVVGTPVYMSPEQAAGRPVDARSDLYSLCAVLHEMLGGEPPFAAEAIGELLTKVQYDDPLPLPASIPRDLRSVVGKGLEKAARDRYTSVADLDDDLKAVAEGRPVRARPLGVGRRLGRWLGRRRGGLVVATLGALCAAILLAGPGWVALDGAPPRLVWPPGPTTLPFAGGEAHVVVRPWRTVRWDAPVTHGRLRLTARPAGATARVTTIDGDLRWTADGREQSLPIGAHEVRVSAEGRAPRRLVVRVEPGKLTTQAIALDTRVAPLTLTVDAPGASVVWRGRRYGLPLHEAPWPVGEHALRVEAPDHRAVALRLRVDGPVRRHVSMAPDLVWSIPASGQMRWLLRVDVDADGLPDVVAAGPDGLLAVSGLTGSRIWRRDLPIDVEPAIGDLDRDATPDIWVPSGDRLVVLDGTSGRPLRSYPLERPVVHKPIVADFDRDGAPDAAVLLGARGAESSRRYHQWHVDLIDGARGTARRTSVMAGYCVGMQAGDVDGDRRLDLLLTFVREGSCELVALGRPGTPRPPEPQRTLLAGWVGELPGLEDLDEDGVPEIGLIGDAVRILDGKTWEPTFSQHFQRQRLRAPRPRDITGDGKKDLLVYIPQDRIVCRFAAGMSRHVGWQLDGAAAPNPRADRLIVTDVDGDGTHELLFERADGSLHTLQLDDATSNVAYVQEAGRRVRVKGSGTPVVRRYPRGTVERPLAIDVDGDGAEEVAVIERGGLLTLVADREPRPAGDWRGRAPGRTRALLGVADVDRDGRADAVTALVDGSLVALDGRTGKQIGVLGTPLGQPQGLRVHTLPDGRACALIHVDSTLAAATWHADRWQGLWTAPLGRGGLDLRIGVGELTGDETADIAWLQTKREREEGPMVGIIAIVDGSSGRIVRRSVQASYTTAPSVVDVDGDGACDLVAACAREEDDLWVIYVLDRRLTRRSTIALSGPAASLPCWARLGAGPPSLVAMTRGERGMQLEAYSLKGGRIWRTDIPEIGRGEAPRAADIDGDGRDELLLLTAGRGLLVFDERGQFSWRCEPPAPVSSVTTADCDGDGVRDVVLAAAGQVLALSGRDGDLISRRFVGDRLTPAPLACTADGAHALVADGRGQLARIALTGTRGWAPLATLSRHGAATALLQRLDDKARPTPRERAMRGAALLDLGRHADAVRDLAAARASLAGDGVLWAALIQASLTTRRARSARPGGGKKRRRPPKDAELLTRAPPGTYRRLLYPGTLAPRERELLVRWARELLDAGVPDPTARVHLAAAQRADALALLEKQSGADVAARRMLVHYEQATASLRRGQHAVAERELERARVAVRQAIRETGARTADLRLWRLALDQAQVPIGMAQR